MQKLFTLRASRRGRSEARGRETGRSVRLRNSGSPEPWNGMERNGDGMESNGMEWNGTAHYEMESNGMEWNGTQ